jgi:hypothetical protein
MEIKLEYNGKPLPRKMKVTYLNGQKKKVVVYGYVEELANPFIVILDGYCFNAIRAEEI